MVGLGRTAALTRVGRGGILSVDLEKSMMIMISYLQDAVSRRDWHAVSDTANDLRVLEERAAWMQGDRNEGD